MPGIHLACIVEGDGDVAAAPVLLRRIASELLGLPLTFVSRPNRQPRGRLVSPQFPALGKALDLAALQLSYAHAPDAVDLILVLIDADDDLPCLLGPELLGRAVGHRADQNIACVLANAEFETWFVAAAESLAKYLNLQADEPPQDPESLQLKKKWIADRFKGSYRETVDQPKLAAALDLKLCRNRSPSFDKLCRELERTANRA